MDTERRIMELAESTLRLEKNEGENKVISLREAIKRNVKTGMVLHITSSAALSEIIRQFCGTKPEFTLIAPPLPLGWNIVHAGLAKKIIFCNTGRSDVFNRAYREKKVNFEIWSFAGISQRLLAGALGTGFIATKSLIGTTMAEENKDSFQVISDPFGCGKKVGIIKVLNPDLTILHGWVADSDGNTILPVGPTPYGSAIDDWSALASKNDVVVTVEKLVSTAFIREHSSMVRIPGYRVNSVSVVPLGAHPGCMHGCGNIKEFEAYDEDSEFLTKYQEAVKNPQRRISNELFGEGPGGAGDAFQSCETVAIIGQSKARFVERAPYITVPGANVKTLVSTLGIFEKLGDDEEFSLTACLPNSNFPTMNEKIENVKTHCSWELKVAPNIEEILPPTFEELMTLRLIDPNGLSRN